MPFPSQRQFSAHFLRLVEKLPKSTFPAIIRRFPIPQRSNFAEETLLMLAPPLRKLHAPEKRADNLKESKFYTPTPSSDSIRIWANANISDISYKLSFLMALVAFSTYFFL